MHRAVSSCDNELVLRDLTTRLDARPVFNVCAFRWHPLAGAVPELHRGAIVCQAQPLAAHVEDMFSLRQPPGCHHCAAA
eukprot:5996575-Amphidinium_carterae.1